MFDLRNTRIGVLGLGYVGLPLAVEFGKQYPTIGLDINEARVEELKQGRDSSLEVEPEELKACPQLSYSSNPDDLKDCNVYIVTVPTPINEHKQPDLSPLIGASRMLGS
ncbi:Vi polysaccharide biosynthesis protein VipA/TviB, partial [Candidatus Endoriftia persephone str. Guaymas]|nr:Vi polysaccharide biosynthesis protein VipA/TviB [Candidatus Endoriftia persephone str. Guaymas]